MATSVNPPARRLFLILAAVTVLTLAAVGLLLFRTRATVVEIQATLDRIDLTVHPSATREAGTAATTTALAEVGLLEPSFLARRLDLQGAGRIEAFLANGGRTLLRPGPEEAARLTSPDLFPFHLSLYGPTPVSLAAGRAVSGGHALRITLPPAGTGDQPWSGTVPAEPGLALDAPSPAGPVHGEIAPYTIDVTLAGGKAEAVLALFLPEEPAAATMLRLVDPLTGDTVERRLPFAISEARTLAWRDRLALLEPVAAASRPRVLLRPGLSVSHPRFFETRRFETRSFLRGGKIRFPGGEKGDLEIEPEALLRLETEEPLTLRSAALQDGHLAILLWGRATSLHLGPTRELQSEELPSLFVWLYTHRLRTLVYSTVASILGLSLAVIKTLGLFKE